LKGSIDWIGNGLTIAHLKTKRERERERMKGAENENPAICEKKTLRQIL